MDSSNAEKYEGGVSGAADVEILDFVNCNKGNGRYVIWADELGNVYT